MKIKTRLYISAGISIFLVLLLASVVFMTSNEIAEKNKEYGLAHNVHLVISELDIITYEYLMHREERMEQQWNLKYNSAAKILRKAKEEKTELIRADYIDLGNLFLQVTGNYKKTQNLIQIGASQKKIDAAIALEERLVTQLLITSQSIITDASRLAEKSHIEAIEVQKLANALVLILMIVLTIIVTTITLLVTRSIAKPINKLIKGTEIIGGGNLEHKIDIKSVDEVGELATNFNIMTKNLHDITVSKDELKNEVTNRKRAEKKLLAVNEQLENANQELEAFSYSVSHDLRAPLTRMDGFSKALQTNYADKLDKKGVHYLDRIRASSQFLAGLIDDLLTLSRISRRELKKKVISLSATVEEIVGTLQDTDKDRKVEVMIQSNVKVTGDTGLLKAMMENLLNNAWKFTHEEKLAKIDFGTIRKEGKNWIFLKDNGIGFNMKYYDKLFTPFQRLHSGEYIGSGIGLSTVQRIINKHGGQIHAESEPGKGTTFYFII